MREGEEEAERKIQELGKEKVEGEMNDDERWRKSGGEKTRRWRGGEG